MLPEETWATRAKRVLIGRKRELHPGIFHKLSLIALLAWLGLGADGLSSSAYGPEEAFKTLGSHTSLALGLAVATALTVFIISYAYSRIIEHFPLGGGGYVVASRLLGPQAGVVSGGALIVDYVLTISISIAAAGDAVFSFLPPGWSNALLLGLVPLKLLLELVVIGLLILLNLRGVKESVVALAPLFLTFLVSHAILIGGVIVGHAAQIPAVLADVRQGFAAGLVAPPVGLGLAGMAALFARAYALGGWTYTGIEAVSNGLSIMREPKVLTGKRTMALMAVSLAATAGGLILAYLIIHATPVEGRTMNAVLAHEFAGGWTFEGGLRIGAAFVFITLLSEALLLVVAGQTGFIDGPRVMANMAVDSYLPHRFSQLSDRLTMSYGVLLIGGASLLALLYTRGNVAHLVVMYSINVFLTFSLSELSMCRFWIRERKKHLDWRKHISVHLTGLTLCVFILAITIVEKFGEGRWITLAITGGLIGVCFRIRAHYRTVHRNLSRLDAIMPTLPAPPPRARRATLEPGAPTAVLLVGDYSGLGIHSVLSVQRLFPNHFKNFLFVSVGVIDSASFVNVEAVDEVRARTAADLERYVALATSLGLRADSRMEVGTEAVAVAAEVCSRIAKEFPKVVLCGETHLPTRALVSAAAAQRDRLSAAASPAICGPRCHGAAGESHGGRVKARVASGHTKSRRGATLSATLSDSAAPIIREDVVSRLHDRMARESALGVVPLRRLVGRGTGLEPAGRRLIVEHGPPPPAGLREPLAVFHHEVDVMQRARHRRRGEHVHLFRVPVDLCHPGAVRERLAVARSAGPVGVDHHGIGEDRGKQVAVLTDGDNLPAFVSPELGEREPTRHLHGVLVLGGDGAAAQSTEECCHDSNRPHAVALHTLSLLCQAWRS